MPRKALLLGLVIAGTATTSLPGFVSPPISGIAEAAAGYYTKKRLNGRWVSGKFPKDGVRRGSARSRLAGRARYASLPDNEPPAPPPARRTTGFNAAGAALLTPAAPTAAFERMRAPLESRARLMALDAGVIAVPLPEGPPPPLLSARSVTFDLGQGLKTVVFEDGVTQTEPFDRAKTPELVGGKSAAP